MTLKPHHFGLYYDQHALVQVRPAVDREPVKSALALLHEHQPADPLPAIQLDGLRYRFNEDMAAGERAVNGLQDMTFNGETPYLDSLAMALTSAQCFEQVRDHPAFSAGAQQYWLETYFERVNNLNQPMFKVSYAEHLWLGALNVGAGITLEREDIFQAGVEIYQQAVHDDIRPEGYIPKAVDDKDGQTFYRQLLAVDALVLAAEAASHVEVDLWEYNNRGVSVMTAVTYLLYYYFYPEKWRWDEGLELEPTQRLFRQHGGFLEMVNRRSQPRPIQLVLDELRPIYDPFGGGLTTLTHALPPKKRGLFG